MKDIVKTLDARYFSDGCNQDGTPYPVILHEIEEALEPWKNETINDGIDGYRLEQLEFLPKRLTVGFFDRPYRKIKDDEKLFAQVNWSTLFELIEKYRADISALQASNQKENELLVALCNAIKEEQEDWRKQSEKLSKKIDQVLEGNDQIKKNQEELFKHIVKKEEASVNETSGLDDSASIASLSFYKVRQLADDLWVNWETGVLAADFASVWAEPGEPGNSAAAKEKSGIDEEDSAKSRRLSSAQIRLLSVLVQSEGALVGWEGADLRNSILWKTVFYRANMRKAKLAGVNRQMEGNAVSTAESVSSKGGAAVSGQRGQDVSLYKYSEIPSVQFDKADLQGASFAELYEERAESGSSPEERWNYDDASLTNLDDFILKELLTSHLEGSFFDGANLTGAIMAGLRAFNSSFSKGTKLSGADLTGAHLEDGVFQGADLSGVRMTEAHLERADFSSVDLRDALMVGAHLDGADFSNADLRDAHMEGAHLNNAVMEEVDLRDAKCVEAHLENANLKYARLCGASLESADLTGADFYSADMEDVYLKRADLDSRSFKNMSGADLTGAYFDESQMDDAKKYGIADLSERTAPRLWKASPAGFGNLRTGMQVEFGSYPQNKELANGQWEKTPLLWRVLKVDEENHRALLVTEKLIDCARYHERREHITWEYCTLRKWMNGEFLREAFTAEEASRIVSVWNENEDNSRFGTRGGNATRDRVFVLSIAEKKECFEIDMDRQAAPTSYAMNKGSYVNVEYKTSKGEATGWWWLRSPGLLSDDAAYVGPVGDGSEFGYLVDNSSVSVRPALWLHL